MAIAGGTVKKGAMMKMNTKKYRTLACVGLVIFVALLASSAHAAVTKTELAGNSLGVYPFFEYVKAINENATVEVAIDPTRFPGITGQTCDVYVVAAKKTAQWNANNTLTDVTPGGMQTETFSGSTIQGNTFLVTAPSQLSGNAGADLGVGYDVVLDCNQDGLLNGDDYIDGRNNESGFYIVHDTTQAGPYAVTESLYSLSAAVGTTFGIPAGFLAQDLYYPTNISSLGQLPLIVLGHGNGHQYIWYDHIGNHLASYGYIVVSHPNNTGPGPVNASTTTLGHTDAFIDQVNAGVIESGALTGHLDEDRIVWIGHSRGGEGVAIAYDRMVDGTYTPTHYAKEDIKLISSMLPTDWQGTGGLPGDTPTTSIPDPNDANFHLWTASGDADVNGSAGCDLCQTFHLHDRATGHRQSTVVQGTGHGWFHANSAAGAAFTGPCSIGETNTHLILKGHLLPLVKRYVEDNIPSIDFLTRQYESFRPIGVPTGNPCIVVSHEYRDASTNGTFIIDDYQAQFGTGTSSSGANVTFDVNNVAEGRLDDNNSSFSWSVSDPFNGATQGTSTDSTRGVVFDWTNVDRFYEWEIPVGERDFTDNLILSFRGAQGTQHPNTLIVLGDLTFDVVLRDSSAVTSSISIGAFGGGFEQPYQRGGGWHNEMETIRIRLTDFLNNGSGLDLSDIVAVRLEFGPSHGSPEGRIVLDDVTLTNDRAVYDGKDNGDPHITTVNGGYYDFQSAGEFVVLRDDNGLEIQSRQTPIPTQWTITNPHTGLASCVSVNTAVAARVAGHRVTYQPSLSGVPDPSGMQLRIDGALVDIQTVQSVNVGVGGRVSASTVGNGIEIDFPDGSTLVATSHWWGSQSKWYLNLSVLNTPATQGVMGLIPSGDWLPNLPDGSSLGQRPVSLAQRYADLNQTFANAWRVSDSSSLFDYGPGTSTTTFTNKGWPPKKPPCEIPDVEPARPMDPVDAEALCRRVADKNDRANCAFDVAVTGEPGFVEAYLQTEKVDKGLTRTTVFDSKDPSLSGEKVEFTAIVRHAKSGQAITLDRTLETAGTVQFTLNGKVVGEPVNVDAHGRASWIAKELEVGKHWIGAIYTAPADGSDLLGSVSFEESHTVVKETIE